MEIMASVLLQNRKLQQVCGTEKATWTSAPLLPVQNHQQKKMVPLSQPDPSPSSPTEQPMLTEGIPQGTLKLVCSTVTRVPWGALLRRELYFSGMTTVSQCRHVAPEDLSNKMITGHGDETALLFTVMYSLRLCNFTPNDKASVMIISQRAQP